MPQPSSPLTCYVAGSTHEIGRVRQAQRLARKHGMVISFDWTGDEGEIRGSWADHRERGAVHAQKEVAAAKCEVFILVTPPKGRGLGCYVELGVALGHGASCFVFPLAGRDSVFFCHPLVGIVSDWESLGAGLSAIVRTSGIS